MTKTIFLRASSAVALTIPFITAPAAAQTAPATDGSTGIEEIIVTATKRDENLVQVPISVSVVTELAIAERPMSPSLRIMQAKPTSTSVARPPCATPTLTSRSLSTVSPYRA